MWSYERQKRFDKSGTRWHFVRHDEDNVEIPYEERPFEIYFRNHEKTVFGVLRFESQKDNPYRDYEMIVAKIMNNSTFRDSLLDVETKKVWNRNWK